MELGFIVNDILVLNIMVDIVDLFIEGIVIVDDNGVVCYIFLFNFVGIVEFMY